MTEILPVTVTLQVPVPEHPPPLQLEKVDPALGEAVKVTLVPELYGSEQSAPQLMPAGLEVTVPEPVPDLVTERENEEIAKVAVTEVLPVTVTLQVPVPEQPPPLQPEKTDPAPAEAVRATLVP